MNGPKKLKHNGLIPYTQKEIKNYRNGKVKIANNETDIVNFVKMAQKFPSNSKLYLGKVGEKVSKNIKFLSGIDVTNYNISLKADTIRHIIKKHSSAKELLRGQVPIIVQDFIILPLIISSYDEVQHAGFTKQDKPILSFKKTIGDIYYLVSYVSDKSHNLEVQTMYKKKNSATAYNTLSPIQTSETNSSTSSSNTDNTTLLT